MLKEKKEMIGLSASRIKTLKSCTWLYYCKYILKLPDVENDGSKKGWIAHVVFESLGNPRHKHHYTKIIKSGDVFSSEPIKRLIKKHCIKKSITDVDSINHIKDMILVGLEYDFFGKSIDNPTESHDEFKFDITNDDGDKRYRIVGFIDKLFLFKKKRLALIRDFKSSKKMFKGNDIEDNIQAQIYQLAVKLLYPKYIKTKLEFAFLQFMKKGTTDGIQQVDQFDSDECEGFEYILTDLQKYVDTFNSTTAISDIAARRPFPTGGEFGGPLMCGRGVKYRGEKKDDGSLKWHCPYRFPFEFYSVKDSVTKKVLRTYMLDKADQISYDESKEELYLEKYNGCPAWKK